MFPVDPFTKIVTIRKLRDDIPKSKAKTSSSQQNSYVLDKHSTTCLSYVKPLHYSV